VATNYGRGLIETDFAYPLHEVTGMHENQKNRRAKPTHGQADKSKDATNKVRIETQIEVIEGYKQEALSYPKRSKVANRAWSLWKEAKAALERMEKEIAPITYEGHAATEKQVADAVKRNALLLTRFNANVAAALNEALKGNNLSRAVQKALTDAAKDVNGKVDAFYEAVAQAVHANNGKAITAAARADIMHRIETTWVRDTTVRKNPKDTRNISNEGWKYSQMTEDEKAAVDALVVGALQSGFDNRAVQVDHKVDAHGPLTYPVTLLDILRDKIYTTPKPAASIKAETGPKLGTWPKNPALSGPNSPSGEGRASFSKALGIGEQFLPDIQRRVYFARAKIKYGAENPGAPTDAELDALVRQFRLQDEQEVNLDFEDYRGEMDQGDQEEYYEPDLGSQFDEGSGDRESWEGNKANAMEVNRPPQVVQMYYRDGSPHTMRDEFRGKSTLELIQSGDRTATTRNGKPNVEVGETLKMANRSGDSVLVRVTKGPYQLKLYVAGMTMKDGTLLTRETAAGKNIANSKLWSNLEGWSPATYEQYAKAGAWQYQYELVGKKQVTPPATSTVNAETLQHLRTLSNAKLHGSKKHRAAFDRTDQDLFRSILGASYSNGQHREYGYSDMMYGVTAGKLHNFVNAQEKLLGVKIQEERVVELKAKGVSDAIATQIAALESEVNSIQQSMVGRPETGPDAEAAVGAKNRRIGQLTAQLGQLRNKANAPARELTYEEMQALDEDSDTELADDGGETSESLHREAAQDAAGRSKENAMNGNDTGLAYADLARADAALKAGDLAELQRMLTSLSNNDLRNATPVQKKAINGLISDLREVVKGLEKTKDTPANAEERARGLRRADEILRMMGRRLSEINTDEMVSPLTAEQADKLVAATVKSLGTHVQAELDSEGLGKLSGDFNDTEMLIRVSMFAKDKLGVLRHEHMHALFTFLLKNGAKNVQDVLERLAKNHLVMGQLKTWLATEKAATAALSDPEEAVAYLYQLWDKNGENGTPLLHLGPQATSIFAKIKRFLTKLFRLTDQHTKDAAEVEAIFQAFKRGDFATDPDAMVKALEAKLAKSELANKQGSAIAKAVLDNKFMKEFIYSNWQVLKETGNTHLIGISRKFHVAEGAKLERNEKGEVVQGSIDATKQEVNRQINHLTTMFTELFEGPVNAKTGNREGGLGKEGVEKARQLLIAKTAVGHIHDPLLKQFVKGYRKHLADMHAYAVKAGVKRFDPETHDWVDLGEVKDHYFHVNWDADAVSKNPDKFREIMKREHMFALEELVKDAELEREANKHTSKEAASHKAEGPITVDDILNAISQHITNTNGADVQENTSKLGITPYAAAVNRRTLTFIHDYAPFDEFMNKDFAQTSTNYVVQMVKRAEYVRQFGNGGEKIQQAVDRAYVEFLLGKDKVDEVEAAFEKSNKDLISKYGYAETMDRHHTLVMQTLLQKDTKELKADYVAREVRLRKEEENLKNLWAMSAKVGDSVKIGDRTYAELAEDKEYLVDLMKSEQSEVQGEMDRRVKEGDETRTQNNTMRSIAEKMLTGTEKENAAKIKQANADLATPIKAIMALEGTLGREISDTTRKVFQTVTAFQNVNKLVFTLFSSFVDPMGIVVRGGELGDAFKAFARGLRMVKEGWMKQHTQDGLEELLQKMGVVEAGTYMDILGETYSSQFAGSAKLHKFNNKFFKLIGMEAWNRAMRIQAGGVAMDFIGRHLTKPTEHSKRYMEELGLDPAGKDTYMKADGSLDTDSRAVQQAVMKWVDGAILNPNAAHRSIQASNPHMLLVYHLKQFTYSFHNVILRRVGIEMENGNYTPLLALASYVPFMIAIDAVKSMLMPGDEPAWMKSFGGALSHGFARAPVGGIPQLISDGLPFVGQGHPMSLFGPAVGQASDLLMTPFSAHHTLLNEGLGLLPAGSQLRRFAPAPPDPDGGGMGLGAVVGSADHVILNPAVLNKIVRRGA
jgi:hypothetical protein